MGLQYARQLHNLAWASQPAQPPTGHGIGFAKAIDDHRAFRHSRFGSETIVDGAVIDNVFVDLITQHIEIVLSSHFDNRIDFAACQDATGRVVRAVDHDQLGLRRDIAAQ